MQRVIFFLLIIAKCACLPANEHRFSEDRTEDFLPGLINPLSLKLALPEDFVPTNFLLQEEPNLFTGTLWASPDTIEEIHEQMRAGKTCAKIKKGAFVAKLTPNAAQTGPCSFSEEESIAPSLKKMGFTDFKVEKKRWGPYPILSVQAYSANNHIAYIYVGLNDCGGNVLFIRYMFSDNREKDLAVWNAFVDNTEIGNE